MKKIVQEILKKENITYHQIKKSISGFTNLVYFIDDKYVIKLSNNEINIEKIKKEVSIYKHLNFDFIPKYVISGNYNCYEYLIITKLEGKSLYSIWSEIDEIQKEDAIKQIANILIKFHSIDGTFLQKEDKDFDWKNKFIDEINKKIAKLKDFDIDTVKLQEYVNKASVLLNENKYGLCYNDAHFDNFIYNNGKIYLIDFDRVRYCPIDYELMIFKCMCDDPKKFASEEDEEKVNRKDFENVLFWLKKYYPSLFKIQNIEQRVKLYQFNYLLGQAIKCKNGDYIKLLNENLLKN